MMLGAEGALPAVSIHLNDAIHHKDPSVTFIFYHTTQKRQGHLLHRSSRPDAAIPAEGRLMIAGSSRITVHSSPHFVLLNVSIQSAHFITVRLL